jgi:hypothetical protein
VPTKKPEEVPDEASWIGDADGGNWYVIESADKLRKEAAIDIYSGQDGELLVSKVFQLDCIDEDGIHWDHLKDQIKFFDGTRIMVEIKRTWGGYRYCYFK